MINETIDYTRHDFRIKSRKVKSYSMSTHHFHDSYEIYYLNSGSRQYFINDSTYDIKPGSLVIIKPQIIHKTMDTGEEHSRFLMSFKPSFLPFESLNEIIQQTFDKTNVIPLNYNMQKNIEDFISKIIFEINKCAIGYEAYLQILLMQFLIDLSRYLEVSLNEIQTENKVNDKISEIINYIKTHYAQEITLELLCNKFYISRYYLSRIFKKTTGFTIIEYIHSIRIVEAQRLLKETKKSVSEIAECVGFHNASNFGRVFKSITKQSPLSYRKNSIDLIR